jgi:2-oxoglutarate ferredoxin oxidoreductase subunit beta
LIHNNQVYGLTKGQASPTSDPGMVTGVQTGGVAVPALNPLALALVLGAGFVARCFSGEKEQLKDIIKAAIEFPGYALVDILQPCVSFNKVNTFGWYKKRVYFPAITDREDWNGALLLAREWGERIPLGIFYLNPRPIFEASLSAVEGEPLAFRDFNPDDLAVLQDEFR